MNAIFNTGQAHRTQVLGNLVATTYHFPLQGLVVDVGGGTGALLSIVLRTYPSLTGLLFDQAHVVEQAAAVLAEAGVAERCRIEAGDFFTAVPQGGDVYLLSNVLNDWDDARATSILAQCRRALAPSARLLLITWLLEVNDPASFRGDLHMFVTQGGRQRTEDEFRSLLATGGFRLTSTLPLSRQASLLGPQYHILEALPS